MRAHNTAMVELRRLRGTAKVDVVVPLQVATHVGKFAGTPSGGTGTYSAAPIATNSADVVVIGVIRESSSGGVTSSVTVTEPPQSPGSRQREYRGDGHQRDQLQRIRMDRMGLRGDTASLADIEVNAYEFTLVIRP